MKFGNIAGRLERFVEGFYKFYITANIIAGIVLLIAGAFEYASFIYYVGVIFGVLVSCLSAYLVALIAMAFVQVVDDTHKTAILVESIAKPESKPDLGYAAEKKIDGWKCSNCGKVNASYVGTCGCGTSRPS